MKTIKAIMVAGYFLLLNFVANAQQTPKSQTKSIEPYRLEIAFSKTTNIIFPHAIISVDRGSKDILAQKATGVENILQVKAARDSFAETNLTVITADGKLTSFILTYAKQPSVLNMSLESTLPDVGSIFLSAENINQAEIQGYAKKAITSRKKLRGVREKEFGVRFEMTGLYIQDEILYCRVQIDNRSNINYDVDQLRFFIRDQKKAKRTATQEIEITPVYIQNNTYKVVAHTEQIIVFALPKFTIPDKKYLALQLMEKNGGRHLELHIRNGHLLNSKPI